MQVRAIRDHFDGVYRKAGDVFEVTGKKLSRHVEKVSEKAKQEFEDAADGAGEGLGEALDQR